MTDAKRMDITKNLELIEKDLKHLHAIMRYLEETYGIRIADIGTQCGLNIHVYAGIELVEEALSVKGLNVWCEGSCKKEVRHNHVEIFQLAHMQRPTFRKAIARNDDEED